MITEKKKKEAQLGKTYLFNNYWAACDKYEDIERKNQLPDEIFTVAKTVNNIIIRLMTQSVYRIILFVCFGKNAVKNSPPKVIIL